MDRMPLIGVLLISVPEGIILSALGLTLVGVKVNWRLLVFAGVIEAAISYLVRLAPLPFGVHTLVQLLLFALVLSVIAKLPYKVTFLAMLISIMLYTAIDGIMITHLLHFTGITLREVWATPLIRVAFFLPQGLTTLTIFLVCYLGNFKLLDYPALTGNKSNDRSYRR